MRYLVLVLMIIGFVNAETSPFSVFGLGDILPFSNTSNGFAVKDSTSISSPVFTSWLEVRNMSYNVSFSSSFHSTFGEKSSNSTYDDFQISGFSLCLPFGDGNIIGASLTPFSIAKYSVYGDTVAVTNAYGYTTQKTTEVISGSINSFALVYGHKFDNFSLAVDYSSRFGTIRKKIETIFESYDDSVPFEARSVLDSYQTSIYHGGFGLSGLYGFENLTLAASANFWLFDYGKKTQEKADNDNIDESVEVEWPFEFKCGLSYNPKKWFTAYSDLTYINFSNVNLGISNQASSSAYNYTKDYYDVALGVRFKYSDRLFDDYFKRISYGVSGGIKNLGIEINDNSVYQYYSNLELIFPYNDNRSWIKTLFGVSMTGDKDQFGMSDIVFTSTIVLSGNNNWWLRKKKYND
ncbi:MAG: hypothetical protein JXR48_14110 [Candidatus Delongbacteria bacterium]|nr:hypothetical protein [Candidatus Delongbacteria bacterium]MBN2836089.1 hypothetical protein [Candidatus Delongbacteria bacterium]